MTRRAARQAACDVVPICVHSVARTVGFLVINRDEIAEDAADYLQAGRMASIPSADQETIRQIVGHLHLEQIILAQQTSERLRIAMDLALEGAGFRPPVSRVAKNAREARDILIRGRGGILAVVEPFVRQLRAMTEGKRGPVRALVSTRLVTHVEAHSARIESAVRQFRKKNRRLLEEDRYEPAERFLKEVLRNPPRGAKRRHLKQALVTTTRRPSDIVDELLAWELDPSGGSSVRRQIMATRRQMRRASRPVKRTSDT